MRSQLVFWLVLFICTLTVTQCKVSKRIVGGSTVDYGTAPYVVQIWALDKVFLCAGTVLSARTILTAASCFRMLAIPQYITAVVGSTVLQTHTHRYISREIIFHPEYNINTEANNIALLVLVAPIDMVAYPVKLISLDSAQIRDGETLTALGWGSRQFVSDNPSPFLQRTELTTIGNEQCRKLLINAGKTNASSDLMYNHVCTFQNTVRGICTGDAGGPLLRNGNQVAVISHTTNNCIAGYPDIHTRIYTFIPWLYENMK